MIKYTRHVLERIKQRGISPREIEAVSVSEFFENALPNEKTSVIDKEGGSTRLRIIYRIENEDNIIITCFRLKS